VGLAVIRSEPCSKPHRTITSDATPCGTVRGLIQANRLIRAIHPNQQYQDEKVTSPRTKHPTIGSLFSGCGGFDLGFKHAGYRTVFANDSNADACETYRQNLGPIREGDVRDLDFGEFESPDVLTAGFPCQPFSNAGSRRGIGDTRGSLFSQTFRAIECLQPKVVIYENVRGILSFKGDDGESLFSGILRNLEERWGYSTAFRLVNFRHFGVPQNRIRVVAICAKDCANADLLFPDVVPGEDLSIRTILKGLKASTPNQKQIMRLNPQALHFGSMIPEGGSWKSLPYEVLPDRWKHIRDNMRRYHYPNFFRRYKRTDTMGTVTAAFKPENAAVWHPHKDRIYTVREIARFQTFPDDYIFHGRTVKSMYQQIGNAVPPRFFFLVAQRVKKFLRNGGVEGLKNKYPSSDLFNVNQCLSRQEDAFKQSERPRSLGRGA
jgi:DNA (cytosine-5)-methyltransferase 1